MDISFRVLSVDLIKIGGTQGLFINSQVQIL